MPVFNAGAGPRRACIWGRGPQILFMNATKPHSFKSSLTVVHVLAELLERLEHSKESVGAEQYRSVVLHLVNELGDVEQGSGLKAILDTHPAAAELYENVNYQYAGLCRSALDASLASEKQAKEAIARASSGAAGHGSNPSITHSKEDSKHGKS
jgi:hypothetical protein